MPDADVDLRQCYEDGSYLAGQDLLDFVKAERGDTLLLSFSRGKDSIAAWLYLRDHFTIVPYYLYLVPGMSWEEESLTYYEEVFGQHIIRLPHPLFYKLLNDFVWQTPETVATIRALDLPTYAYADVDDLLANAHGLDAPFCAMGIRSKDNLDRRRLIQQKGVVGLTGRRRFFYPIWDWNVQQVGELILAHGVKLPADYAMFGRTVVAMTYRRLKEIRNRFPADFARILDWFPLAGLELFRYEQVG
jgi:hypothetical protein